MTLSYNRQQRFDYMFEEVNRYAWRTEKTTWQRDALLPYDIELILAFGDVAAIKDEPFAQKVFDHFRAPRNDVDVLAVEYRAYLEAHGLADHDAEEMLCRDLAPDHRAWISEFVRRWEAISDLDRTVEHVADFYEERLREHLDAKELQAVADGEEVPNDFYDANDDLLAAYADGTARNAFEEPGGSFWHDLDLEIMNRAQEVALESIAQNPAKAGDEPTEWPGDADPANAFPTDRMIFTVVVLTTDKISREETRRIIHRALDVKANPDRGDEGIRRVMVNP